MFEPSARNMSALLDRVIRTHGPLRHLVSDQGPQLTAAHSKAFVRLHGIRHRYDPVGKPHSIGLIDRFFRTLKHSLGVPRLRPRQFRGFGDFRRRLEIGLVHYSYVRPHAALGSSLISNYVKGSRVA